MNKKGIWADKSTFIEFSEPQKGSLSAEIATRDRSIDFYSLGMYLPNPDPVLKKMGKDIKVYTELLSDAHVGGCAISRKAGVKKLLWDIDRGKAKSRQAKFVTDAVKALDIKRIIGEILNAAFFGYQPLEVMWDNGPSWTPDDVVGKPQDWFVFDEQNRLRFRTKTNYMEGEELPDRKFLLAQHEATYANPYGFADLSRCFWPATFKKGGWKFWVKFIEKYGMPWPVGKLPRGQDQKDYDSLADILEKMVQDGIAVIPDDSSIAFVEATSSKGASGSIHRELIQECKTEISVALLGHAGSSLSTPGKLGGEDQAGEVRSDRADDDKGMVEETLNTLIKWIAFYNFSERVELPRFILYEEEDVDKALAERDKILTDTGVKFTPGYYVKAYGLDESDFEVGTPPSPQPGFYSPQLPPNTRGGALSFSDFAAPSLAHAPHSADAAYPDQAALDKAIGAMDPAVLKKQMEGVLKPVFDMIAKGTSYEEIRGQLADIFPNMKDKVIQEMLGRAIFVSELWGRLSAEKK